MAYIEVKYRPGEVAVIEDRPGSPDWAVASMAFDVFVDGRPTAVLIGYLRLADWNAAVARYPNRDELAGVVALAALAEFRRSIQDIPRAGSEVTVACHRYELQKLYPSGVLLPVPGVTIGGFTVQP